MIGYSVFFSKLVDLLRFYSKTYALGKNVNPFMQPNPKNWDQKRHPRIIGAFIVSPVRSDKI